MTQDHAGGSVLTNKPVFDWNQNPVGTVEDISRDPKTKAARTLVLHLSDEARDEIGGGDELLSVPVRYVFGIRRDSVTLDRSLDELRRIEDAAAPEATKATKLLQH